MNAAQSCFESGVFTGELISMRILHFLSGRLRLEKDRWKSVLKAFRLAGRGWIVFGNLQGGTQVEGMQSCLVSVKRFFFSHDGYEEPA